MPEHRREATQNLQDHRESWIPGELSLEERIKGQRKVGHYGEILATEVALNGLKETTEKLRKRAGRK